MHAKLRAPLVLLALGAVLLVGSAIAIGARVTATSGLPDEELASGAAQTYFLGPPASPAALELLLSVGPIVVFAASIVLILVGYRRLAAADRAAPSAPKRAPGDRPADPRQDMQPGGVDSRLSEISHRDRPRR